MDVDFDHASSLASITVPNDRFDIRLRWLGDGSTVNNALARSMLRRLGQALGSKNAAILVDLLISDFYEATLDHSFSTSSVGQAHLEWLHQWIGSLVIVKEVGSLRNTGATSICWARKSHRAPVFRACRF